MWNRPWTMILTQTPGLNLLTLGFAPAYVIHLIWSIIRTPTAHEQMMEEAAGLDYTASSFICLLIVLGIIGGIILTIRRDRDPHALGANFADYETAGLRNSLIAYVIMFGCVAYQHFFLIKGLTGWEGDAPLIARMAGFIAASFGWYVTAIGGFIASCFSLATWPELEVAPEATKARSTSQTIERSTPKRPEIAAPIQPKRRDIPNMVRASSRRDDGAAVQTSQQVRRRTIDELPGLSMGRIDFEEGRTRHEK